MTFFTKRFTHTLFALIFLSSSVLMAQTPFWTEEFEDPTTWTALEVAGDGTPTANWVHTPTGPAGMFSIGPLMSSSPANGWMLFDSDDNCSGEQDVWLISPKLDLTDKDIVIMTFESFYRRFNDLTFVNVSTDSMTWEPIEVHAGLGNGDYGDGSVTPDQNPHTQTLDLTQYAANQGTFWFAFRFQADQSTVIAGTDIGCGYSWQIDNINLYDEDITPSIDLRLGDYFYPPRSFATPVTQIEWDTMGFSADISNLGTDAVTNAVLKVEVLNGTGGLIWEDSLLIPEIAVGVMDSTFNTPNLYAPEGLVAGTYSITYNVYSLDGDDGDMSNNSGSEDFLVTADLFSKENSPAIGFIPAGGGEWGITNLYEIDPNVTDCFMAYEADWFAFTGNGGPPLEGNSCNIVLWEVDQNLVPNLSFDFDGNASDFFQHDQLILKSLVPYTYTSTATQLMETVELEDFDLETLGVELTPGGQYFLSIHYPAQTTENVFHGFSQEITYINTISTIVWSGGTWFLGGFGPMEAATIRMRIALCNVIDVEETTLPAESLTAYPNPASDILNVEVDLETSGKANLTIADLQGRVIQLETYETLQKGDFQFDVSDMANGTYLIRLATEEGTKTMKFIVQH